MRRHRIVVLALVALAAAALPAHPARAGIGDIISDFLYYQEALKVKAPARPAAEVVTGIGDRYLALIDAVGAVRVWDFESGGQMVVEGRRPARVRAVFPSQRGSNFVVAETDGRVYETAGMSFSVKTTLLPAGTASDAVAVSSRAPVVAAAGGGRLHAYNLETRQDVAVTPSQRVTRLWVSDDGRFVAYDAGGTTWVLDADRGRSLLLEPAGPTLRARFYHDATGGVALARQDAPAHLILYRWDGRGFTRAAEHAFGTAPEDFWIRNDRQVYWTSRHTLNVSSVGATTSTTLFTGREPIAFVRSVEAGDDLLIVQQSGVLGVLARRTGKMVVTAISTENGWAVIDANKRYDGSASGGREIAWVIQATELDLERFSKRFYEPGLLLHYVGRPPSAFASVGHQGPIPVPPTVSEVKLLDNVAGSGRTVVLATARNVKDEIAEVEVYHNGKRVADSARITDQAQRRDDVAFRSVGFEIHPVAGPNTVAAMGVGRLGIEGPAKVLDFQRPGATAGTLHVLAVGIDHYAAPALDLRYARRDAEAIVALMRTSKGFDRVTVSELYDADAKRDAVLARLRSVAAAARPGDTVMIYLAGHGVAIRGDWYFLSPAIARPSPAEVARLSPSAEQVATALKESRASRIVLMVDACNSGAVVKDIKGLLQNRVYSQLGRETGFVVLAASRQDQAALEQATLGHGIFTAAVTMALSGAADRNGDGRVTARELVAYLSRQIPTLATEHLNEIQIPVAYAPSEDFVVRSFR